LDANPGAPIEIKYRFIRALSQNANKMVVYFSGGPGGTLTNPQAVESDLFSLKKRMLK
jgi:hypothetical protein